MGLRMWFSVCDASGLCVELEMVNGDEKNQEGDYK
jgi:hypothetical protein